MNGYNKFEQNRMKSIAEQSQADELTEFVGYKNHGYYKGLLNFFALSKVSPQRV